MIKMFSREKFIRVTLFIALAAAILLPLYNVFFIYPSFRNQLIQNIQDDAVRVAAHLSSTLVHETTELKKETLPLEFINAADEVKRDFKLWKLKLFSSSGEIIYSTDPKDIGVINKHPYFHEIVAKGNPYSVIVKKGNLSLEGQKVTAAVAETYVPIMRNGKFIGAYEIYYDITERKHRFDTLTRHYSCILFFVGILSVALIISLFKANNAVIAERDRWNITFNSISEPIAIIDRNHRFVRVNKAMADKLNIPADKAVGLKCYEAVHGKSEPILQCPHKKLLADGQAHTEEVYEERLGGWYLVSVSPIHDAKGQVIASVHIAYDISARKKVEEELKKAYEDMVNKNKELERFHNLTVDRELRMIELKGEVNELLRRIGEPERYETNKDI
jgi:PAS domain S-box-containing protein